MKPRHISTTGESAPLIREPIPARRSRPSVRSNKGIKIEEFVTINRPVEELYAFWRNFENLPRFMEHLDHVECLDQRRSHWRMRWPKGKVVEWDADVINEHPNELIAWRTLEDSDIRHAGTVRFTPAPDGRGTEVKLTLEYEPGTRFVSFLAKLVRRSPEQQISEDLRCFKRIMEAGEVPTIEGQSAARAKARHNAEEAK